MKVPLCQEIIQLSVVSVLLMVAAFSIRRFYLFRVELVGSAHELFVITSIIIIIVKLC